MTTWMDLEGFMLDERRQKKRKTRWPHLHVESKKQNRMKTLFDTKKKQVVPRGEGVEGWANSWKELKGTHWKVQNK